MEWDVGRCHGGDDWIIKMVLRRRLDDISIEQIKSS